MTASTVARVTKAQSDVGMHKAGPERASIALACRFRCSRATNAALGGRPAPGSGIHISRDGTELTPCRR